MAVAIMILPVLPLAVAALIGALGWRPVTAWLGPLAALVVTGIGIVLAVRVLADGPIVALGDLLRVDALSALMVILIGVIGALTTTSSIAYLATELAADSTTTQRARLYGVLMQLTIGAMLVVVIADNLGVLWVAIEASTIATVLLVGHRRDRMSVEASWKYLVLGSVGVATALLGTVLVYFISIQSGINASSALNWSTLAHQASSLDPGALRVAIALVIVGYGTKAGLAPLHSWLPDAYSQAPAPVAALMAGALSAMAMYALLRFKVIADGAIGPDLARNLLLIAGLASLVVAASLMVTQRDYKRLLAYSSVENMGLIALAAAIGSPLAMGAALLHMIGNGLAKSVAFSSSGEILFATGTTRIGGVRDLLHRQPFVGAVFALSLVALIGLPPFSILASEVAIFRSGVSGGFAWVIVIALALMLAIFTAVVVHGLNMLVGRAETTTDQPAATGHVTSLTARVPLVAGLLVAAVLGITLWPISRLVGAAAEVLTR